MSRHARHASSGLDRSEPDARETGATPRSGEFGGAPERAGNWAAVAWPESGVPAASAAPAPPPAVAAAGSRMARRRASRARAGGAHAGTVGVVAYLAVVVCIAAGLYISWRQGSNGGGKGAVAAGAALLVAAVARMLLPGKLAGLLASRRRVTDVLTLTVFGAGLLVTGLVLPRLGSLSAQGRMAGPPMKGKHE
jgi:hypothetical protein